MVWLDRRLRLATGADGHLSPTSLVLSPQSVPQSLSITDLGGCNLSWQAAALMNASKSTLERLLISPVRILTRPSVSDLCPYVPPELNQFCV